MNKIELEKKIKYSLDISNEEELRKIIYNILDIVDEDSYSNISNIIIKNNYNYTYNNDFNIDNAITILNKSINKEYVIDLIDDDSNSLSYNDKYNVLDTLEDSIDYFIYSVNNKDYDNAYKLLDVLLNFKVFDGIINKSIYALYLENVIDVYIKEFVLKLIFILYLYKDIKVLIPIIYNLLIEYDLKYLNINEINTYDTLNNYDSFIIEFLKYVIEKDDIYKDDILSSNSINVSNDVLLSIARNSNHLELYKEIISNINNKYEINNIIKEVELKIEDNNLLSDIYSIAFNKTNDYKYLLSQFNLNPTLDCLLKFNDDIYDYKYELIDIVNKLDKDNKNVKILDFLLNGNIHNTLEICVLALLLITNSVDKDIYRRLIDYSLSNYVIKYNNYSSRFDFLEERVVNIFNGFSSSCDEVLSVCDSLCEELLDNIMLANKKESIVEVCDLIYALGIAYDDNTNYSYKDVLIRYKNMYPKKERFVRIIDEFLTQQM